MGSDGNLRQTGASWQPLTFPHIRGESCTTSFTPNFRLPDHSPEAFLSDPKAATIRQYGVLHPKGGEEGKDIARPAEFLVDAGGTIRWVNLTDDIRVRARPESVLAAIDRL